MWIDVTNLEQQRDGENKKVNSKVDTLFFSNSFLPKRINGIMPIVIAPKRLKGFGG